jgi:uncharacterized membrane protein YfcA
LQASVGLLGHLQHANIDWPLTLAVFALAVAGNLAGVRLATRIPAQLLRTGFGWFLIGMASLVPIEQAPDVVRHALAGTATGRIALAFSIVALALAAARHVHSCRTLAAQR